MNTHSTNLSYLNNKLIQAISVYGSYQSIVLYMYCKDMAPGRIDNVTGYDLGVMVLFIFIGFSYVYILGNAKSLIKSKWDLLVSLFPLYYVIKTVLIKGIIYINKLD